MDTTNRPYKVLVVDDEDDVVPMFRQQLRRDVRAGRYELLFATSGVEALSVIRREGDVDLVITDINMPDMDGLELLAAMRSFDADLRAVVLSAYGDMKNVRIAMNRGAFDFVLKPVDFEDMRITMERTLDNLELWRGAMSCRDQLVSLNRELDIAGQIQQSVLPVSFPNFEGYILHAGVEPVRTVAGDFYDVMPMDGGRIGLVVADVSGKGIPAAMLMMSTRTLVRGAAIGVGDAGRVLYEVNRIMCKDNPLFMFVTLFFGVFDPVDGSLTYANAGHPAPLLYRSDGSCVALERTADAVLGIIEDEDYGVSKINLNLGDGLFLFTDGVPEAMNGSGELFGWERMHHVLSGAGDVDAEECCHQMVDAVRSFADGQVQSDDITCMVLKRLG